MSSPSTIATALIAAASAVVVPVITAALAGLGFWLKERSDRRDRDNERHRVLTQVRQEIDVIEAWVKVYGLVAPPEDRSRASSNAQHDLDLAYTRLAHSLMESRGVEPRKTFHEHLKAFLLIGRLHSRSAKAVRVLYYVSLACAIIMVTVFSVILITQFTSGLLLGSIILLVLAILITLGFYQLAVHIIGRASNKPIHQSRVGSIPPSSS